MHSMRWKLNLILVLILLRYYPSNAQSFPFPQHTTYTSGTLKPSAYKQSDLDKQVADYYNDWKATYLKDNCGGGQYYIWCDVCENPSIPDMYSISVSEGHGYGMMITALMAGHDTSAQKIFNGLFKFYKNHQSEIVPGLMAWQQVTGCIDNHEGGSDAATDGDLDIAYALLLADRQWGSSGTINYLKEARTVMAAIKKGEISSFHSVLLGDWASPDDHFYEVTRSSDFIPDHFKNYYIATGDTSWLLVANKCYELSLNIQKRFSPTTGLVPDFIDHASGAGIPAAPETLEGEYDGHYNYNACRFPWRITTDYLLSGDQRAYQVIHPLNHWIHKTTQGHPDKIMNGYFLDGNTFPNNTDHSPAFTGGFTVAAMCCGASQKWLDASYEELMKMPVKELKYFDNTLRMLQLIVISGNWWSPYSIDSKQ